MKLIYLFAGLMLFAACGQDASKTKKMDNDTMEVDHHIMFYNVENLFDTFDDKYTFDDDFLPDSPKKWDEEKLNTKLDRLNEVILSVDKKGPLFIGMVEIENSYVLKQLLNHKKFNSINYNFVHHNSSDERGIDVALIYNEDYFSLISDEPLRVDLPDNDGTRDILYVKGIIKGDDQPIHIFVNHWPSRREGQKKSESKRIIAAKTLRSKIELIQEDKEARIVVMGDFNDYPNNTSITKYLKAKGSHSVEEGELFNLAASLHKKDKGTYNYKGDWVMLDQMMVSKSMLKNAGNDYYVKQKGLKIFKEKWVLYEDKKYHDFKPNKTYGGRNYYGGYSDHLPIYIKLDK